MFVMMAANIDELVQQLEAYASMHTVRMRRCRKLLLLMRLLIAVISHTTAARWDPDGHAHFATALFLSTSSEDLENALRILIGLRYHLAATFRLPKMSNIKSTIFIINSVELLILRILRIIMMQKSHHRQIPLTLMQFMADEVSFTTMNVSDMFATHNRAIDMPHHCMLYVRAAAASGSRPPNYRTQLRLFLRSNLFKLLKATPPSA